MHAKRVTMPHIPTAALLPIAAAGRFDRVEEARAGIEELSKHHSELLEAGIDRRSPLDTASVDAGAVAESGIGLRLADQRR
jgi:hypothetical protein